MASFTRACLWLSIVSCSNSSIEATNNRLGGYLADGKNCAPAAASGSGTTGNASGTGNSSGTTATTNASGTPAKLHLAEAVYYKGTVDAIIKTNCLSCHGAGGTAPDLSTFAGASGNAKAALKDIEADKMPQSKPLSDADKATFKAWVDGGILQEAPAATTASTSPTCVAATSSGTGGTGSGTGGTAKESTTTDSAITYKATIGPYLAAKCVSCHGAGGRSPDLSTADAAEAAASAVTTAMSTGKMPPSGPPSSTELDHFKAWVSAGFP